MDENLNEMNVTENVEPAYTEPVESTDPVITAEGGDLGGGYGDGNDNDGKKNTIAFTIILIAVLALLVIGGVVIGKSLSGGGKFVDALTDDYIFSMQKEMMETASQEGKHELKYTISIAKILTALSYEGEKVEDIALANTVLTKGDDASGTFSILYGDEDLINLDYAKTGDVIGVKLRDLFENYIMLENKNLKALAENYGINSGDIPDQITEEELIKLAEADQDYTKLEKIGERYIGIFEKHLNKNTETLKDQTITINGEDVKTNKIFVALSEVEISELFIEVLEKAANDEDLYNFAVETDPYEFEDMTFEDWKAGLEETINEGKTYVKEEASSDPMVELAAYVRGKDTVAIEAKYLVDEEVSVRIAGLNDSKESFIELAGAMEDQDLRAAVEFVTEKDGDAYNCEIAVVVDAPAVNMTIDVMEYAYEYSKKYDEKIVKLDKEEGLLLNTAEDADFEELAAEIEGNSEEYLEELSSKVPEGVVEFVSELVSDLAYEMSYGSSFDSDYDYDYDEDYNYDEDYDYDYDYDEDYDWDYDSDVEFTGDVKVLDELVGMYEKVEIGMTREDLIKTLGEYDTKDSYSDYEFLGWRSSADDYMEISIMIEDGKVCDKELDAYSSSYDNISLSKELGTTLEDLDGKMSKVKEGMTMSEVEAILGDAYFESERDDYGYVGYTWYDVDENYVEISFDEGKVDYVGTVWSSY